MHESDRDLTLTFTLTLILTFTLTLFLSLTPTLALSGNLEIDLLRQRPFGGKGFPDEVLQRRDGRRCVCVCVCSCVCVFVFVCARVCGLLVSH